MDYPLEFVIIVLLVLAAGSFCCLVTFATTKSGEFLEAAFKRGRPILAGPGAASTDVVVYYYTARVFLLSSGGLALIWLFFALTR